MGSHVLNAKYDMDAHMATLFGGDQAWDSVSMMGLVGMSGTCDFGTPCDPTLSMTISRYGDGKAMTRTLLPVVE